MRPVTKRQAFVLPYLCLAILFGCQIDSDTVLDAGETQGIEPDTAKWAAVADYLGMELDLETSDPSVLVSNLTTPPRAFSPTDAEFGATYGALATGVVTDVLTNAATSQCAEFSIQEVGDAMYIPTGETIQTITPVPAKYYIMTYKLLTAAGTAEETARNAIVTAPVAVAAPAPLVMYSHALDIGASYGELVAALGSLQQTNVIAMPSFPGEPWCTVAADTATGQCDEAGVLAEAVGEQNIYANDVTELLGLYNCIAFASQSDSSTPWNGKIQTNDVTIGSDTYSSVPTTYLIGSNRGGLVNDLAVSYAGIMHQNLATIREANPVFNPPFFHFAWKTGGPTTWTLFRHKIMLKQMLEGTFTESPLAAIPTYLSVNDAFAAYRDGTLTVEQVAVEIAKRDMAFMATWMPYALKNWTMATPTKGYYGTLHGVADAVFPYHEAQAMFSTLAVVNAEATLAQLAAQEGFTGNVPGFNYANFAIQAADSFYQDCGAVDQLLGKTKCFNGGGEDNNHITDASFLTGTLASLTTDQKTLAANGDGGVVDALANGVIGSATFQALGLTDPSPVRAVMGAFLNPATTVYGGDVTDGGLYTATDNLYPLTPAQIALFTLGAVPAMMSAL